MFHHQLMLVIAILLSSITICYGVVFAYQLGGGFFIGTLLALMAISFNLLEFTCSFYARVQLQNNNLALALVITVPVALGIVFSLFANTWVISNQYSEYRAKLVSDSEQYKAWIRKKQDIEQQISEYQKLGLNESVIVGNIQDIDSKIDNLLSQTAYNSANLSSGQSVGEITADCSNNNFYFKKYCGALGPLKKEKSGLLKRLETLDVVKQLKKALDDMGDPPTPKEAEIPAVASISQLTGVDGDYLISLINVFFAFFNEFGAILAWYLISNIKQPIPKMAVRDAPEDFQVSEKLAGNPQLKESKKK